MKELVMYIVKALVDNPDEVTVEETMQKDEIILKLKVSQDDVGNPDQSDCRCVLWRLPDP